MASLNPDPWRVTAAPPPASPRAGSRSYTYTSPPTCAASSCAGSAAPTSAESNANTSAAEPLAERAKCRHPRPIPTRPAAGRPPRRADAVSPIASASPAPSGSIGPHARAAEGNPSPRRAHARLRATATRTSLKLTSARGECTSESRDEFVVRLHRFPLLARATREAPLDYCAGLASAGLPRSTIATPPDSSSPS